jgi:hypothetical protein
MIVVWVEVVAVDVELDRDAGTQPGVPMPPPSPPSAARPASCTTNATPSALPALGVIWSLKVVRQSWEESTVLWSQRHRPQRSLRRSVGRPHRSSSCFPPDSYRCCPRSLCDRSVPAGLPQHEQGSPKTHWPPGSNKPLWMLRFECARPPRPQTCPTDRPGLYHCVTRPPVWCGECDVYPKLFCHRRGKIRNWLPFVS